MAQSENGEEQKWLLVRWKAGSKRVEEDRIELLAAGEVRVSLLMPVPTTLLVNSMVESALAHTCTKVAWTDAEVVR